MVETVDWGGEGLYRVWGVGACGVVSGGRGEGVMWGAGVSVSLVVQAVAECLNDRKVG